MLPVFGDRRPLTPYPGLNRGLSELTEMEEFLFEGARGDSRPLRSERPGKLRSRGDWADPVAISIPFWGRWSPVPFGCNEGRECEGLSRCELDAARPLCWNESTGPVEGGNAGEGGISFWNTSCNGDWKRGESRPRLSEAYLGEPGWLELVEATEDLFCEDSIKTEGSKAIAGFIDCRLAARDVGGCNEAFNPLVEVLTVSFINICKGRTPSS